jgi:hypothetical protein
MPSERSCGEYGTPELAERWRCRRRPPASAALPLPGAPERQRSASYGGY